MDINFDMTLRVQQSGCGGLPHSCPASMLHIQHGSATIRATHTSLPHILQIARVQGTRLPRQYDRRCRRSLIQKSGYEAIRSVATILRRPLNRAIAGRKVFTWMQ
jgi:hypothetical protein